MTASFFLFSNPPKSAAFVSATTMAPQLDTAQHILIETLLNKGFETKLIASEASCSVRAVQRIRLKQFEMPIPRINRVGRHSCITSPTQKISRQEGKFIAGHVAARSFYGFLRASIGVPKCCTVLTTRLRRGLGLTAYEWFLICCSIVGRRMRYVKLVSRPMHSRSYQESKAGSRTLESYYSRSHLRGPCTQPHSSAHQSISNDLNH